MNERALIYHTETGVICGRFATKNDAQQWLDSYMVSQSYKDRCYRIELVATYYERHQSQRGDARYVLPLRWA